MANNTDVIDLINENTVLRTHIKQRDARIADALKSVEWHRVEQVAEGSFSGATAILIARQMLVVRALLNTTS